MKLQCRIYRPGGTEVELPNDDGTTTTIKFKPVDPTRADSPHVAEVEDMDHVAKLIAAAPETYVAFKPGAVAEVARPGKATAEAQAAEDARSAQEAADKAAADAAADTSGNGVVSIDELKAAIKAGTYSQEQLRELMAQEEESEAPRSGFISVITKALK